MMALSLSPYWFLLVAVVLSSVVTLVVSHDCESFDNVRSDVLEINGQRSSEILHGCIERKKLHNKTIVAAYFRNQSIPKLGKDSVRHLVKLETISFWGCDVETVEAGAFRNLPRLKDLQISFARLKKIPTGVFNPIETLQLLRIHDNKIDLIEKQAFANLTSLKKIYAANNQLGYWCSDWFDNATNLEILDFQHNKIRAIPKRAFAALPRLKRINFDFNEISIVRSEAFRGLEKLEYLGLRNNRLTVIDENVFPRKIKIGKLLLNANYLNYLSAQLLKRISTEKIFLDYNPWKCSCLDEIHAWIRHTNGSLRMVDGCESKYVPVCVVEEGASRCSEHLDEALSRRYFEIFANLKEPLISGCARLM